MTPLHFERLYEAEWQELSEALDAILGRAQGKPHARERVRGDRVTALYRRACEHLALARARAYPAYLLDRLDRLTSEAHQVIYQRREFGLSRLASMVAVEFPRAVRAHAAYVWVAAITFCAPLFVVGLLVYIRPELILSVTSAEAAAQYESMYSAAAESIGRERDVSSDWMMFAFYISNNVGIAFQCFAAGLFAGIGSLFFLIYNGAAIGAVAGYLTERGLSPTFYSFVATHSSFELTAIVLSGAAGLRLGHSLLAPGRRTRVQSLVAATKESAVIMYGATAMLLVAAAIEAFWSSASWLPHVVKYSVAGVCWLGLIGYLTLQGRSAS